MQLLHNEPASGGRAEKRVCTHRAGRWLTMLFLAWMAVALLSAQGTSEGERAAQQQANLPPRVIQAERFLAQRGWTRSSASRATQAGAGVLRRRAKTAAARPQAETTGSASWQPLGPTAVTSQEYGLVTGRVSALALDPSDTTGNTLYVGTTGGGVWKSQNADTSDAASVAFTPLTDSAFSGDTVALCTASGTVSGTATDASISIGALTVPPGAANVILAGTGDPNDALDSYYGAGILRSTNSGTTWCLIPATADGLYSFTGEGFAGFAWSTVNTELVVAAVSQAYEGTLAGASVSGTSYEGLFYSTDGGLNWSLATITDGSGAVVQGPNAAFAQPDGNAVTAVVWNPVRQLFVAAVRYHGYYQSTDGKTFTRMSTQPGSRLASSLGYCPANTGYTGSTSCPIFRGALAVNPTTGDTFAWTVDIDNQDQGLWQDKCAATSGACANANSTMWAAAQTLQWNTAALEAAPPIDTTIANGDYNLTLAAVPSGQETMVLAGANDLWKTDCPYSQGCRWRNTTNSTTCMSAQVGEYQHALAWNVTNPLEIFVGNDSGLWRSTDAIGEAGSVCASTDAAHFQNLNGGLGSLAEVVSLAQVGATPYTMMAGLGANGTAGVKSTAGVTTDWPEILGGEGGPVVIDPNNSENWYVNNAAGVSIHRCSQSSACTPTDFGASAVVNDADVGEDGLTMTEPAPFLVDPLDTSQLLIGTCRVWRGPADGVGWNSTDAVSPILDKTSNSSCSGDALIRTMAAMALPVSTALPSGGEVVYAGMYSEANGGALLPGHVWSATYNSATSLWSSWTDLTSNPVSNDTHTMNYYGLDISSIFIDSHDTTGKTVYVTVAGIPTRSENVQVVYGSTDGGASWTDLTSNLPAVSANSLVVDPGSAGTVYVATDAGVYATQQMLAGSCKTESPGCWAPLGSGLPASPVVALSAAPATASVQNLVAATYGRGIWMTALLGAGTPGSGAATDTLSVNALTFPDTNTGQLSAAQTVTLTNSGGVDLTSIAISVSGPFQQTNACTANLVAGSSCAISVQFAPTTAGSDQTGTLTVNDILLTQTVDLNGTGIAAPVLAVSPTSLTFTGQTAGVASSPQTLMVSNTGSASLANVGFQITGASAASFSIGTTTCGATLAGGASCAVQVIFTPLAAGGSTAALVVSSSTAGVAAVSVPLTGTGQTLSGLNVSPAQLTFPLVAPGNLSAMQTVTITNNGSSAAALLTYTVTSPFSRATVTNSCGASLAAGASCSVGVEFAPTIKGSFTGTLTIASPSLASSAVVSLSGTGGEPGSVAFQPSQLTFAQTGVSVTSGVSTVTITNPDSVTGLSNLTITPSPAAEFKLASTTCGTTLAPLASCTVGVTFTPASAGARSGMLTVTDNLLTKGTTLMLSGTGFDFALCFGSSITPCVTTSSQTIANGGIADYHLTIEPLGGTKGSFTLQCGTLPAYSSCTFNPTSPTPFSTVPVYETVKIATGLSTSSAHLERPSAWPALPLVCGGLLLPLALWRRRKALLLVALLAILTGGVSSCAGSSIGRPSSPSGGSTGMTPAGSYSIPVTVTSNGISHQLTLKLTVD